MDTLTIREQQNQRKGQLAGAVMFLFLVAVLLMPLFWYQNPPPGQEGIQVNLGIPDIGMGDELNAPIATTTETEVTPEPEPQPEPQPEVTPPPAPAKPEPVKRETVTTEDPNAIALQKKKAQEDAARRAKEESDRKAQEESDRKAREAAEAKRKAEAEAEAKRKAAQAAAQATRDQVGGLFNAGGGGGNTNKPGDGGARDGDPNSSNIGNKSFGSGTVGGGLGSRGIASSPTLQENSQKSGIVVISLCVLANGKVESESVKFTQRGSTTTDAQLVAAAIRNAKSWGFTPGSVDKQCGTITYNFKVQ